MAHQSQLPQETAGFLQTDVIIGRAAIAYALGRSERTVTRWIKRGLLPVIVKRGPFENSLLAARVADIKRASAMVEGPSS